MMHFFFLNFQLSSFGLLLAEVPGEKVESIPGPVEAPEWMVDGEAPKWKPGLLPVDEDEVPADEDEDDEAAGKFHKSCICIYIYIYNTY